MSSRASLNHIYRTVWNQALGAMVAVAEIASPGGRSTSPGGQRSDCRNACVVRLSALAIGIASAWLAGASNALANPSGGSAIVGQASMLNQGNKLTVTTQNGALGNYSAINWQSFSIPAGSTTYFQQPNVSSTSINRVVTNNPSQIFGTLGSNGNLVLVNQSGITVGAGAVVDSAGFTASSLRMSDADALAGRMRFGDGAAGGAGVSVQGSILARSGDVVLLGTQLDTGKDALIQAPNGSTLLAAGRQIELTGRGLEGISLQVQAPVDSAINLGTLKGDAVGIFAGTLKHSGLIQASTVSLEGGRVVLKAAQRADLGGVIEASGTVGGSVDVLVTHSADPAAPGAVIQTGGIDVHGAIGAGGAVRISADTILSSASINAEGASGGGAIAVQASRYALSTTAAHYSANSVTGQGGDILMSGGLSNYTSGVYSATGVAGGAVTLAGDEIKLAGTRVDVSGTNGGGSIHVGGMMHGAADFAAQGTALGNASSVLASASSSFKADAQQTGNGGEVVLWSDQTLHFGGNISARGGATGGDGGRAEVSGLTGLRYDGVTNLSAPKGAPGTLFLDPKNITIVADSGALAGPSYQEILDPTPGAGEGFGGTQNRVLPSGNLVVSSPLDSTFGTNSGAVYLFSPTGALMSTLVGSSTGDQVGGYSLYGYGYGYAYGGLTVLGNGNVLVASKNWSGTRGAVSWMDGVTGALSNGSFGGVVDGTSGVGNSLTGSTPGDFVGNLLTPIANNKVLVMTPTWSNQGATSAGAVSWLNGANGKLSDGKSGGPVSISNSLLGSAAGDQVGSGSTTSVSDYSTYTNYVVASPQWGSGGTPANALGALTWINGATGGLSNGTSGGYLSGSSVGLANSLVGSTPGDKIGTLTTTTVYNYASYPYAYTLDASGISAINGHLLVSSNNWSGQKGALTWMNGATGALADQSTGGAVSVGNSLIGAAAGDRIGTITTFPYGYQTTVESSGLVDLGNGNYLVRSALWGQTGSPSSALGAVTWWGNNSTGVTGVVGSSNSIVGSTAGDRVGAGWASLTTNDPGVAVLPNGNYVVVSSNWSAGKGAVTWGDGVNGTRGTVAAIAGTAPGGFALSLVGVSAGDYVGSQGIQVQQGGSNFVVKSPLVNSGSGALTWMNGDTGVLSTGFAGAVLGGGNSLLGGAASDGVGGDVLSLDNGNFLAKSVAWNGSRGAVTWLDGSNGKLSDGSTGAAVALSNSLLGSTPGDMAGGNIVQLGNGNVVVVNPEWNNGGNAANAGAVTWLNGGSGQLGISTPNAGVNGGLIGNSNSLVGTTAGDFVGYGGVSELSTGHVLVRSPNWSNGPNSPNAGAVSWMNGATGELANSKAGAPVYGGKVGADNSLVSAVPISYVGNDVPIDLGNGKIVIRSPGWHGDYGAATWMDAASGKLSDGSFAGVIGPGNSLVGTAQNDGVGSYVQTLGQNYVVFSSLNSVGALTWMNGDTGLTHDASGLISPTNSLLGLALGDYVGSSSSYPLNNGNMVFVNSYWGGGKGAATWMKGATGQLADGSYGGWVSASNSLVGSVITDSVGSGSFAFLGNGNYVVGSPGWNDATGAVTYGNGATGTVGPISAANSLVGSAVGDRIGSGGLTVFNYTGNILVHSPEWGSGGVVDAGLGAATWMSGQSGALTNGLFSGVVGPANSLVGSSIGDRVGSWAYNYSYGGLNAANVFGNGNVLIRSENWSGGTSALTWMEGATGKLSDASNGGVLSASNSLLGGAPYDNLGAAAVELTQGNWVIRSPQWGGAGSGGNGRGAVTWMNGSSGRLADGLTGGLVSVGNSLVGSVAGDRVGGDVNCDCSNPGGISALSNGNYVLNSPEWNARTGAVTWADGASGTVGVVSARNSLLVQTNGVAELGRTGKVLIGSGAANGGSGGVYLIDGSAQAVTGALFADSPGVDATIGAGNIAATLNGGTNVVLQANSDITQQAGAGITATGSGNLTLQAGRSVVLNDGVNIGGNLKATANDPGAVTANRAPGAGVIDTSLATITAGSVAMTNYGDASGGGDIATGKISATGRIDLFAAKDLIVNDVLSTTTANGDVLLRADNGGTGTGTISFAGGSISLAGGSAKLYYNPVGYADSLTKSDATGDPYASYVTGPYTAWMLVNDVGAATGGSTGLQAINTNLTGNYALGRNMDATATATWNAGFAQAPVYAGFTPIGYLSGNASTNFTGRFDGLGHTISNLMINRPGTDFVGLFGYAGNGSVIGNVGLVGGSVTGQSYVGALAGYVFSGTVSNSYATGTVSGTNNGINNLNALQTGQFIGGLVGDSGVGSVTNSYATGNVNGFGYVGGLVGFNNGSIANSYASGGVSATGSGTPVGGLVGGESAGGSVVSNSFWDSTSSGQLVGVGGVGAQSSATALTHAQMMQTASFSSWNTATPNTIANVGGSGATWRIYEGHTTPLLTSFLSPLTLAGVPDVSVTYNGSAQSGASISTAFNGVSGVAATGVNAGFYNGYYSSQQGYDISGGNLTISPANVILSAISLNGSRVYDGTNVVNANIFSLSGLVGVQTLTLSGSGTVADKRVGINKPVSLGSLTLGDGTGGGLASNYTFSGGTQVATITPAPVAVTGITAANKVYDGNTSASLNTASATLAGAVNTDSLSVAGATGLFSDKNAGLGKTVNISGLSLTGTDAANYTLSSSTASATADISKASITAITGIAVTDKVYDGSTTATLVTSGANFAGMVAGDRLAVGSVTATFADRNVGSAKTVNLGSPSLSGTDAVNYVLTGTVAPVSGNITVRPLSTWTAVGSGQWSSAANWDVLPDASNVLAVSIPAGVSVTYDAAAGAAQLQSISGNFSLAGGSLSIAGGLSASQYAQTGGALSLGAALNVTGSFSQTAGTIVANGPVTITQNSGALMVGSITAPAISLAAPAGSISQSAALVSTGLLSARSLGSTLLNNAGNRIGSFSASSTGVGDIGLTSVGAIDVQGINAAAGNVTLVNTGGISTSGPVVANGGAVSMTANSPLTVGTGGITATGNIDLLASNLTSAGNLTLNGNLVSSAGAINMTAANNFVQNSSVSAALGLTVNAAGSVSFGPLAQSSGNPVNYWLNGVAVAAPTGWPSTGGVPADFVATFLTQFEAAIELIAVSGTDPLAPVWIDRRLIAVEGDICSR